MTYQGSKVKYSKYIVPILQKKIDDEGITTFVDCCCGGANIVKEIKCENRIAIDKNPYLIALWKELQKPDFVFPPFPTREDWDRCKNGNEPRDWYTGLVQIFTSYLARGFGGGYNKQERQYTGRVNTVKKDLPLIRGINFICDDYSAILNYENVVIYIDPPYEGTKKYQVDLNFDYNAFWDVVRAASSNNWVYISEQTAPPDFIPIWSLNTARRLQGKVTECVENLFVYNSGKVII